MLTKVKRLLHKKSIHNGMWLYALQIFNTIVPLITLPYITRILGASKYGVFSIALNFIGYLQVIIEYGFGMSATRRVTLILNKNNGQFPYEKNKNGLREYRYIFTTVLFSRFILLLISIVIAGVYAIIASLNTESVICLVILFIGLFGYAFQQNWLFQGLQDMKYISIATIIARTASVFCIFALVRSSKDLFLYCIFYSFTNLIGSFLGFGIAITKYRMRLIKVKFADVKWALKDGWYVFTTSLSGKIFGAIGVTFLGLFASSTEVGIYSAIQKIPLMMNMAWAPISQVIYPITSSHFANSYKEGKNFVFSTRKKLVPLFALISLIIAIFSKTVVYIAFGQEYVNHFYWIIPLLVWLIIGIDNNFFGIQLMLGSGHDKQYSKCFMIGVVATIVFNFILIYFYKGDGACIAPLLSELALNIMLRQGVKKLENAECN